MTTLSDIYICTKSFLYGAKFNLNDRFVYVYSVELMIFIRNDKFATLAIPKEYFDSNFISLTERRNERIDEIINL
jgi:hypothetical protein